MSILYGLIEPDAGEIRLGCEAVRFRSALDAIANGMGMVHQAFKLFNSLTVWENVTYAREPRRGVFIDRRAARRRVIDLGMRHHLEVDPDAIVGLGRGAPAGRDPQRRSTARPAFSSPTSRHQADAAGRDGPSGS
jgi:ABC-type uncharacterized transport system ATPase subunit